MVTKQWRRRADFLIDGFPCCSIWSCISGWMIVRSSVTVRCLVAGLSLMVGFIKHEQSY